MAKFYGKIGYELTTEIRPSVYEPTVIEKDHYGDMLKNVRRFNNSSTVNGEIRLSNTLSIVADPFALQNFHNIRYVVYMGAKWTVTDVDVQYPRLLLALGGVYNGDSGPEVRT